jgi:outer membrane lipoprotein LolB
LALALVVLMAGCAAPPRRAADAADLQRQTARERVLAAQTHWRLNGKIAVSDGRDGGSGRIDWEQQGESFDISLRSPVSGRSWRLHGGPGGATLAGLDSGPRQGPDAQLLLEQETGWSLPIEAMSFWARGARGVGSSVLEFDPDARPARLLQAGWTIEYRAWGEGDPPLPTKVFANHGERRVRLVVDRWHVADAGG